VVLFTADSVGAVTMTFSGNVSVDSIPEGFDSRAQYHSADDVSQVILYSMESNRWLETGVIMTVTGATELLAVDAATYRGWPMDATVGGMTDVDDELQIELPTDFALDQNYPNPFNPSTTIDFALPTAAEARVWIYNTLGQRVTTLVDESLPAGYHEIEWDGTDMSGNPVASGIYFYRLEAGDFVQSRKMMLLK
ncbi:T9SS type A sorting domain-containing protein, partial [candidate division GN15 bacterium]|nr:T9SS type A sorting domain-containing protein [candidate division GN15 bacterium]